MYNIVELVGTRYIYSGLNNKVEGVLEHLKDGSVVDLTGAKFGPACASTIVRHQSRLNFVSSDPKESDILQSNAEAIKAKSMYPEIEVPQITSFEDIIDFIGSVHTNVTLPSTTDSRVLGAYILLLMAKPEHTYNITRVAPEISNILQGYYIPLETMDCYYCGYGYVSEEPIPNSYRIPKDLGSVKFDINNPDLKHPLSLAVYFVRNIFEEELGRTLQEIIEGGL